MFSFGRERKSAPLSMKNSGTPPRTAVLSRLITRKAAPFSGIS